MSLLLSGIFDNVQKFENTFLVIKGSFSFQINGHQLERSKIQLIFEKMELFGTKQISIFNGKTQFL